MTDESDSSAAEKALDAIAAICGTPEWEYPGQVVRDVEELERIRVAQCEQILELRMELVAVYRVLDGQDPKKTQLRRVVLDIAERKARRSHDQSK